MAMNLFEKMAQAYSKRNHATQQLSNLDKQAIRRMQMKDWADKRDKFNELAKRLEARKVVADNDIIDIPSQQLERLKKQAHRRRIDAKQAIEDFIDGAADVEFLEGYAHNKALTNKIGEYNFNLPEELYDEFLTNAGYYLEDLYKPEFAHSNEFLINKINDIEPRYK